MTDPHLRRPPRPCAPATAPAAFCLAPALAIALSIGVGVSATAQPAAAQAAQGAQSGDPPRTHAEASGWTELSPHTAVVAFYEELAERSPEVRLSQVGRSREGRPILQVTMARPGVATPRHAHATGRPIVFIGAQVHGNEQASKEGLMIFARDLALGPLNHLLDDLVFVFVPQMNPDGGEAETWGTRANLAGYNINRDYVLLENPETQAVVEGVLVPWQPHVIVDAHELTGARWYDFYTLHPSNVNGPTAPRALAAGPATDAVREAIEGAGFTYFPYHLTTSDPREVPEDGIRAAGYGIRTLRGYGGAQGAVTLLFESRREEDARIDLENRTLWQRIAMEGLASWVARDAQRVLEAVADGRREMAERGDRWDPADTLMVEVDFVVSDTVAYRMPEMRLTADGEGYEPTGQILDLMLPMYDSAVATLARPRPVGYLIQPHREDLARHLVRHGLEVERYDRPLTAAVESFRVESIERDTEPYEGYQPRKVRTTLVEREVEIPAGAFLVRAGQPAALVAFSLLEPEDPESFASAGFLTAEKRVGGFLPVHRLRELPAGLRRGWTP